jgi:hypothetical protein
MRLARAAGTWQPTLMSSRIPGPQAQHYRQSGDGTSCGRSSVAANSAEFFAERTERD